MYDPKVYFLNVNSKLSTVKITELMRVPRDLFNFGAGNPLTSYQTLERWRSGTHCSKNLHHFRRNSLFMILHCALNDTVTVSVLFIFESKREGMSHFFLSSFLFFTSPICPFIQIALFRNQDGWSEERIKFTLYANVPFAFP